MDRTGYLVVFGDLSGFGWAQLGWRFCWIGDLAGLEIFAGLEIWLGWIFGRVGDLVGCEVVLYWTFGWTL